MIRVSAGIIRKEGKILICRRGQGRKHAGLWEFPGGKQEAGETAADCLARELQEELSLPITAPQLLCTREAEGIVFDFITCETSSEPVLTEHDLNNVRCAAEYGVTGLMQPFVHSGEELRKVRKALQENGADHVKIFAKIENMQGVDNLEDILPEADWVIIARGDLGNDMDLWQLPAVQKKIAAACVKAGKPFVVVTQMLASMEHSPVPTRAEVSDIFNAVLDGCAGVMVTGETAVGDYPTEVIRYLTNTVKSAEDYLQH